MTKSEMIMSDNTYEGQDALNSTGKGKVYFI
jgi:hypothetical protein